MMTRTERMKLLVQAIGADIKAILAKTNLLKTAAYKDVGTTSGKIPEFVGNDGMGGFGFGGRSKDLGLNVNLNTLPKVNAIYGVSKKNVVVGLPADLQVYLFNCEITLQVAVSPDGYYITQTLTAVAYKPPGTSILNAVVFTRCSSFDTWGPWTRISGRLTGVDSDGDSIGSDGAFNSITVGLTSPKMAFKALKFPINYENLRYGPDGLTQIDGFDSRGGLAIQSELREDQILQVSCRVYYRPYSGASHIYLKPGEEHGGRYYTILYYGSYTNIKVSSAAHTQERDGNLIKSGQGLIDKDGYAEVFIIYKVD